MTDASLGKEPTSEPPLRLRYPDGGWIELEPSFLQSLDQFGDRFTDVIIEWDRDHPAHVRRQFNETLYQNCAPLARK